MSRGKPEIRLGYSTPKRPLRNIFWLLPDLVYICRKFPARPPFNAPSPLPIFWWNFSRGRYFITRHPIISTGLVKLYSSSCAGPGAQRGKDHKSVIRCRRPPKSAEYGSASPFMPFTQLLCLKNNIPLVVQPISDEESSPALFVTAPHGEIKSRRHITLSHWRSLPTLLQIVLAQS